MNSLRSFKPILFQQIDITTASKCVSMQKLLEAGEYVETRTTKSAAEIATAVLDRNGSGLSLAERQLLPNLILQAEFDEFQDAFAIKVLDSYSKSDRFWRRLFRAWLLAYAPESSVGGLVIDALSKNLEKLPSEFRNLARKYPILSKAPDFRPTALSLLNNELSVIDRISLGLGEAGIASSRLANRILVECAGTLKIEDATVSQLRNFRELVAPNNSLDDSVRMVAMVGLIMGANHRSPGEEEVQNIARLIGETFDDPIIRRDRWPSVPNSLGGMQTREQCIAIVKKWQAFRSINLFFNIIEAVVDSEHKHQFPVRKQFWLNYFDRGIVTDAWVCLGTKAAEEMERVIRETGRDYAGLKWGKLRGGPSDQCALLLQLGDTTVMEFSHNGRARIWGAGDRYAIIPKLHLETYQANELRADCPPDQMITHDPNGNWRIRAERCIARLSRTVNRL